MQLGHGKYQRRIQATVTSETRHIAVEIASDKRLTNQILDDLGLPVPRQARSCATPRRRSRPPSGSAIPVVVKPLDGNHGTRRVDQPHDAEEQVRAAFEKAYECSLAW